MAVGHGLHVTSRVPQQDGANGVKLPTPPPLHMMLHNLGQPVAVRCADSFAMH
jgi:hypothetical protein